MRYLYTLALLIAPSLLSAQDLEAHGDKTLKKVMTLEECVQFAQSNSPQVLTIQPQIEQILISEQLAKEAFLPSVNGQVGENVSFGRAKGVDGVSRDLSNSNTSFGVTVGMDLFTGGSRWFALEKAREALKSKDYITHDVLDRIALSTTEAYITLLLSQELTSAAEDNLTLSQKLLKETETQVELGKLPISQKIQIQSQVGQDELTLAQAKADEDRAKRLLLLNMGIADPKVELEVSTPSTDEVTTRIEGYSSYERSPEWMLPGTQKVALDLELSKYDVKIARSGYLPSLGLTAGYSNEYYYNFGKEVDRSMNLPFADQMKQNGSTFVGLTLNIPIYNRGQVRNQVRQAELQEMNLKSQYILKTFEDEQNILLAETDLRKEEEQYRISKQNLGYTQESLDIADLEYRAGRITSYEWEQAKNNYIQAQATYLRSIYSRLLRTINLAYYHSGKLPFHLAE